MKNVIISVLCATVFNQYLLGTYFQNFLGISLTVCFGLFLLDYIIDEIRQDIKRKKRLERTIRRLRYEKIN